MGISYLKKIYFHVSLLTLLFSVGAPSALLAASQDPPARPPAEVGDHATSRLFDSNDILEITLKTDLATLVRDRTKTYHSATLSIGTPEAPVHETPMRVSTRGMTSLSYCQFPHIRFKLNPDDWKGTVFEGQNKLKIVTHCNNPDIGGSSSNEQRIVLLQYTIYRMYSILTDYSFKVRLARIHYVDRSGYYEPFTKYAFFIEPLENVAARHAAEPRDRRDVNREGISVRSMNTRYAALASAFEFMIGNGDWVLLYGNQVHFLNMEGISNDELELLPVPYDFDRAGMCSNQFGFHDISSNGNTFPIISDSTATLRGVYHRYFAGRKVYQPIFDLLREKKDEIFALYEGMQSLIDEHYQGRTLGHLQRFYNAIGNDSLNHEAPDPTLDEVLAGHGPVGQMEPSP